MPSNRVSSFTFFFFFNDPATTEIYTLSLHDALPISPLPALQRADSDGLSCASIDGVIPLDRKSGSAGMPRPISYAVFCLKKKESLYTIEEGPPHTACGAACTRGSPPRRRLRARSCRRPLTQAMAQRLNALVLFFFFNDTATTEIYTLSLHDALPI